MQRGADAVVGQLTKIDVTDIRLVLPLQVLRTLATSINYSKFCVINSSNYFVVQSGTVIDEVSSLAKLKTKTGTDSRHHDSRHDDH